MPAYDLIVVGSGSAAGVAATSARQAGWRGAVIDTQPLGGTCANRGCDPTNVLVGVASAGDALSRLQGKGAAADAIGLEWPPLARFVRTFTDPVPASREADLTRLFYPTSTSDIKYML